MNTSYIGSIGEEIAVKTLLEEGYTVLERNAKLCDCEVDIVCECYLDKNGNLIKQSNNRLLKKLHSFFKKNSKKNGERTVVFCEVKTRYGDLYGTPEDAITPYKIGRYVTFAKAYILKHCLHNAKMRFDVMAIDDDGCRHIVGAFDENDAKYSRR